jgi:hypothetical protein
MTPPEAGAQPTPTPRVIIIPAEETISGLPSAFKKEQDALRQARIEGASSFAEFVTSIQSHRHTDRGEIADRFLKTNYPPDGKPTRNDATDFEIERDYHKQCDELGIDRAQRLGHSQLLRRAGRRK